MTTPATPRPSSLDFGAADNWPVRAAAHLLGAGLLLAVLVALPAAPTDLDRHQLPKETLVHLVTWLAVLLARPLPVRGLRPAAGWALGVLLLVTACSALTAGNGWLALRAASLMLTGVAAFLTARHLAALGQGPVLLGWCGVAGVIGAATGLAQAYGAQSPLFATTRIPGGTFGNRNFMAHFATLTLPPLVLIALTARRRWSAALATIGCCALAAAIILSRSRAAWLGATVALAIFTLIFVAARRRHALPPLGLRAALVGALLGVGALAAIVLPNHLSWRSASPYTDTLAGLANHEDGSGHGRLLQYRNTIRLAARHPILGVGPGNWPVRYGEVAPAADPTWVFGDVVPINPWPSSDWMALLSEVGPLGVAAALLFGFSLLWSAAAAARAHGERVLIGAALAGLVAAVFVIGNLDAVLLLPSPLLLVALAAGALLGEGAAAPPPPPAPGRYARLALVLPVLLAIVTFRSALQTAAYVIADSGRSVRRLSWAARVDPGSYPIRIALAERLPCQESHDDIVAVSRMAPTWPATVAAARRCGVRIPR